MLDILIYMSAGFCLALLILGIFRLKRRHKKSKRSGNIYSSIEEIRSVGELVVFKILTKEIVTADEHWLGEWGRKYLRWIISTKKMAMIFEFSIDFRYDLQSPDFLIKKEGDRTHRLVMPRCFYETYIKDIHFYDEQNAKLLPWLLPDLLNRAFGMNFDEKDKNRLKDEAKQQASNLAQGLVKKMRSEVQNSARKTLEVLAKGFGAERVIIDFGNADLVQTKVDTGNSKKEKMS